MHAAPLRVMRIFMTGATGVIGRRALPQLVQRHAVTVCLHDESARKHVEAAGAQCAAVDLFDPAGLQRAMEDHDTVINLATHIPASAFKMLFKRSWAENNRIRTEGVRNLVDAALACGVTRFLQESFAPAYPDCGDDWIDESTPLDPPPQQRSVVDAEAAVTEFAEANRTGVILRFGLFYGPDATQIKSIIRAVKLGFVPLPGSPRAFISSISHDDAARAVVAALTARSGAYNICDDQPMRRGEYFAELAHAIGVDPPRFLPAWTRPMFGAAAEAMSRSTRMSNRKFRGETGWHPLLPSMHEGWRATLRRPSRAPVRAPA